MNISALKLYDGITNIDEEIIEEAEGYVPGAITVNWKRWGALAASLVIIGAGAFGLMKSGLLHVASREEIYATEQTSAAGEKPAEEESMEMPAAEPAEEPMETPMEVPAEYEAEPAEAPAEDKDTSSKETAPLNPILRVDFDPGTEYQAVCFRDIAELYDPRFDEHDPEFLRLDANDITEDDLGEEMGRITGGDYDGCRVCRIGALPKADAFIVDCGGSYVFIMAK